MSKASTKPTFGAHNPFAAVAAAKHNPMGGLRIADDPIPPRNRHKTLFIELFEKLKPGQCIVCPPGKREVTNIAARLRHWIKKTGKEYTITYRSECEDGQGRVWMLAKDSEVQP